jgi:hypothetical protein
MASRRYVHPKRRLTFNGLQGIISQNVLFFVTTAVRNPSGRTMALGLTQPLTEMSTRNLNKKKKKMGVKCGRRIGLTALPRSISRFSK